MAILKNSSLKRKGFFSIDALFAIILLLLIISTLVSLYQGRTQMAEDTRTKIEGKMISEKIAGAINTVTPRKPVSLNLNLPENIQEKNYTIQFSEENRIIFLELSGSNSGASLTGASVAMNKVELETNLDLSQEILIHWKDNKIKVENP